MVIDASLIKINELTTLHQPIGVLKSSFPAFLTHDSELSD